MIEDIFISGFLGVLLATFIIYKKNFFFSLYTTYDPDHKTHSKYVPPIGGIIIFVVFFLGVFLSNSSSSFLSPLFLIITGLIFFIGLIDDLFGKASAKLRFLVIFLSSLVFVISQQELPLIEIPFIKDYLIQYPILKIIFYAVCLTALTNGFNIIDGVNGLTSLVGVSSVICLIFLYFHNQYFEYLNETVFLFLSLSIFLIFNFPFGKIFLGDCGAYLIGWILGTMVIKVYTNNDLNTWGACLLLFYPTMEVIFSFIRKIVLKKSPFKPDLNHLHLKIFFNLKKNREAGNKFNSIVTLILIPFWTLPIIFFYLSEIFLLSSLIFIIVLIFIYLLFYILIPKVNQSR